MSEKGNPGISRLHAALITVFSLLALINPLSALSQTAISDTPNAADLLTLPQAIELALGKNPLVRGAAIGREIAGARLLEARSGRLPSLQLGETITNGNNPVFVFGSLLEQGRFRQENFDLLKLNNPSPLTNFRFGATFKFPVFDQRSTATRIAISSNGLKQADHQLDQVAQRIRFEVIKAYFGLMLAESKRTLALESVRLAEADVRRSRDRVEAGTTVTSDLMSAEVQLAEFRQQQIQVAGEIATAKAVLNTVLGATTDAPVGVAGQLAARTFVVADQTELVNQALQRRPELAGAAIARKSSADQLKGTRGELLPRVDTFANFGVSRNNWVHGSSDYTVGASVTFNLFDAGRKARISQAEAATRLAETNEENLRNQIRLEVVRAYQEYDTARQRQTVADQAIAYAMEANRIVQDRYHAGLTTITEVLRAETALVRARLNLLTVRHDCYVSYANLLLMSGSLVNVEPFAK